MIQNQVIHPYLIDNQWKESLSGKHVHIISPESNEVVGLVPAMTQDEVHHSIELAKEA